MRRTLACLVIVSLVFSGVGGVATSQEVYGGTFEVTWDSGNETFLIDGEPQSQITLTRGVTYEFNVDTPNEPFHLTTDDTLGNNYSEVYTGGVTIKGNSTKNATSTGTLEITVPESAPDDLYYTSTNTTTGSHIFVVDEPPRGEVDDEPIPAFIGTFGIIPYWLIAGLIGFGVVAGYLGGRESDEIRGT